jgi:hypothetical protein
METLANNPLPLNSASDNAHTTDHTPGIFPP